MEHPSLLDRVRGVVRRAFFWLPSSSKEESSERPPEAHHDHALVLSVVAPERMPRLGQLRHLLRFLTPLETRLFLSAAMLAVLSLGTAATAFTLSRLISVPVVGGTLTEAVVGEPKYLNPLDAPTNDVDRDLVRLIYSGLFRLNGTEVVPDLAEHYRWSEDRKTLTVRVRKDARFHDGVPLTAADVRFTIENAQDPSRKSPLRGTFHGVRVSIPDQTTAIFTLDRPDPQFLIKLTIGILPAHVWQNIPSTNARLSDLNLKPIGSGPFRVKSFLRDNLGGIHSYTLERVDRFYGAKPFIKTAVFRFFTDRVSAMDALKANLVDAVAFSAPEDARSLAASGRVRDIKLELPQMTIAFFNVKDKILSSNEIRQALTLAVNRTELLTAQGGSAELLDGPYPFETVSSTSPDLERARELLTEANWILPPNGNIRIWSPKPQKKKKPLAATALAIAASSTELAVTVSFPNDAALEPVAESLKRAWSLLGIHVTLEPLTTEELMRRATRERTTHIVLLNILLGPDQDLFPFWWSGQAADRGLNISNLKNRAVDDALEALRNTTTTESLRRARGTLSSAILATTPALFVSRPIQHYLISQNVKGIPERITAFAPAERFQTMEQWYKKMGWRWK